MKFFTKFIGTLLAILLVLGIVGFFVYKFAIPRFLGSQLGISEEQSGQWYKTIKKLSGFEGKRTYLVLLQNYDELRPTGGFIGSYGVLSVENGKVINFFSEGSEHIDNCVPYGVAVPRSSEAVRTYLGQGYGYFRDSNWNPNFEEAAPEIVRVYASENGAFASHIDGVVAFTPDVFKTLLQKIGSITVDGVEFNADNFSDNLEYQVEIAYSDKGLAKSERKNIIAHLATEMLKKVSETPYSEITALIELGRQEAAKKNIQLFDYDNEIESMYASLGWSGGWGKRENDFFAVVDGNLGGFKTDRVMKRSQSYSINPGTRSGRLALAYFNSGVSDYRTREYKSYTRVYFPEGTQIAAVQPIADLRNSVGKKGFDVYQEDGFTVVGFFFTVPLQKSREFVIDIVPSKKILQSFAGDAYKLFARKQAGARNINLTFEVHTDRPVLESSPSVAENRTPFVFKDFFTEDKEFELKF